MQGVDAFDALAIVKEVRCPREDPEQAGEVVRGVYDLPNGVQGLAADIAPNAQDGFHFVNDDGEPAVAGALDDLENAAQVRHRVAARDIPLHARERFRFAGTFGLPESHDTRAAAS